MQETWILHNFENLAKEQGSTIVEPFIRTIYRPAKEMIDKKENPQKHVKN